jgi:hypothetical protein
LEKQQAHQHKNLVVKNYLDHPQNTQTQVLTMIDHNLKVSAKMAVVMGFFLPILETVRRSNQILDYREFFSWFDDYIMGAILLAGAYRVFKKIENAVAYMIAVWGIGVGFMLLSFIGQFRYYGTTSEDPGIFSTTLVAIGKGVILGYMLVGLNKAIKASAQSRK